MCKEILTAERPRLFRVEMEKYGVGSAKTLSETKRMGNDTVVRCHGLIYAKAGRRTKRRRWTNDQSNGHCGPKAIETHQKGNARCLSRLTTSHEYMTRSTIVCEARLKVDPKTL